MQKPTSTVSHFRPHPSFQCIQYLATHYSQSATEIERSAFSCSWVKHKKT